MGHSILCRGSCHLVIPRCFADMVAHASRGGGRSVRIVAAVSPWKSFAVSGRPAPARLKRHTSLWFNSSARNLCDIPDTRYPSGRQSWFGAVVLSLNSSAAFITMKAGLVTGRGP